MELREFKEFLLLEKIEKREFAKVFADDTIRIGIEFECYIDGLAAGSGSELRDAAVKYREFLNDVKEYVADIERSNEEWEREMYDNIRNHINDKKKEIQVLRNESDKYEQEEWEELITELEDEIDEVEALTPYELEDNDYDIDYYSQYESGESVYMPDVPYEVKDYIDAMVGVGNDFESEIRQMMWQAAYEGADMEDMLQQKGWAIYDEYYSGVTTVDDLENFDWSIFPFDDYVIGDYHGNDKNFHQWRIELDESTGDNGVEIISPIMKLQDALPVMKKMFTFINRYGGTTNDQGMHVNISKRGAGLDNVDLLKLMLFVDEGFVWKHFPDRKNNSYSKSVLDKLVSKTMVSNSDIKRDIEKIHNSAQVIFPAFKSKLNLPKEKFQGVNFSNLHAGSGRIEMRYLGGEDYHKKYKDNVSAIGRYVYYLLLSLDPEFKKIEYAKKLLRLSNKFSDKNTDKIINRQYTNIITKGRLIGEVLARGMKYYQLDKFVYELSNGVVSNTYSLKSWENVKRKLKGFLGRK